ncbi:MAG: Trp biosynthesis-associated membrane protein [Nocardioidaceae bacterium]|nr:Trp biosynthesis-associated membrane protein [Nocardioidaceae bacterium]
MAEPARRGLTLAVLGGVAAGAVMLGSASRPWASLAVRTTGAPPDTVTVTGSGGVPLTGALALVVLAGSVAILATSGRPRRVVGVVIAVVALTAGVVAVTADAAVRSALADAVAASPAALGGAAATSGTSLSWWRWVDVAGAVAAAVVGGATAWRGHTWSVMGTRYESPAAAGASHDDDDPWHALDAGRDPTA